MRHLAFATSLIGCLHSYQEANAQGFWYTPPGADLSYVYGIDLGNGLGFGYGFGIGYGSFQSPGDAVTGAAADLWRYQNQSNVMTPQSTANSADDYAGSIQDLQQRTAAYRAKQRVLKLEGPKARDRAIARSTAVETTRPGSRSSLRLNCMQFDRSTGKLVWPEVLLQDSYSEQRTEIESFVESLTQKGASTDLTTKLTRKARELHDELRKQIRAIPTKEFLQGHQFLDRLELEGRLGWPNDSNRLCA